jgi:hypothetical protein
MNFDMIAKAFVEGFPYYEHPYIVVNKEDDYIYTRMKTSAIGLNLTVCDDMIRGPVLLMLITEVRGDGEPYYWLVISPRYYYNVAELVEVYNAVFSRLKDVIGITLWAENVSGHILIYVDKMKYPFMAKSDSSRLATIVKRKNLLIQGYLSRFAPIGMRGKYAEIYNRLVRLYNELRSASIELDRVLYHFDEEEIESFGFSREYVKRLVDKIDSVCHVYSVVNDVGVYIGKYSVRGLLSLYERLAHEADEVLTAIKTKIATDMLLS